MNSDLLVYNLQLPYKYDHALRLSNRIFGNVFGIYLFSEIPQTGQTDHVLLTEGIDRTHKTDI